MKFIGKLFKGFFLLVGLLVVIGIFMAVAGGDDEKPRTPKTEAKEKETPPETSSAVVKANYDKIVVGDTLTGEGGTTLDEVTTLLGKPDSSTESTIDKAVMKTLTWSDLWGGGGTITVTLINDKVSDKMWME